MIDYHFRLSTPADVSSLAPRLRKEDKAEIAAHSGLEPYEALARCAMMSDIPVSVVIDGRVSLMFGVGPSGTEGCGIVWLLADDVITKGKYAREFARVCRPWVEALHTNYPALANFIDARNTVHIRWLQWCGFTIIKRHEIFGAEGLPFLEFVRIRKEQPSHV